METYPIIIFKLRDSDGDYLWIEDTGDSLNVFSPNFEVNMDRDKIQRLRDLLDEWLKRNPCQERRVDF